MDEFEQNSKYVKYIKVQLENIINETKDDKKINDQIDQLKGIIGKLNFMIDNCNTSNKKLSAIMEEIKILKNNHTNQNFKESNKINKTRCKKNKELIKNKKEIAKDNNVIESFCQLTQMYGKGDKYEGDIKNNKKDGKGTIFYKNGDKFEGEFKDDKQDGKGIFYFNNGDRYEGIWKNGKMEYKGILYYDKRNKYINSTGTKPEIRGIFYYDIDDQSKDNKK